MKINNLTMTARLCGGQYFVILYSAGWPVDSNGAQYSCFSVHALFADGGNDTKVIRLKLCSVVGEKTLNIWAHHQD